MRLANPVRFRRYIGTITIVQNTLAKKDRELFVERVGEALDLIKAHDPAAGKLIGREIRYIANAPLFSSSAYERWSRACKINFDEFYVNDDPKESDESTREWYVASVAATLIFHATQGRLYSLGMPYTEATRKRFERLCARRQRQFVARLRSETYELMELAPAFDEVDLKAFWNPERRRERQREMRARYWPEIKALWARR